MFHNNIVPACIFSQPQKARLTLFTVMVLVTTALLPLGGMAQQPPDAGLVLKENISTKLQPIKPSVNYQPEGQPLEPILTGGPQIQLKQITLTGNTVYSNEQLLAVLGNVLSASYDLAGLRELCNQISLYYRANGYPFARAYLPEQKMADGVLTITVVEGRYGAVQATGDSALARGAQRFLAPLKSGDVIESGSLERTILILGDQPGVAITPIMRPGTETGCGNLDIQVTQTPRVTGLLSADNHGDRYSGEYRAQAELYLNRAIIFGDEISLRAIFSNENLWLGQLAYSLPLGYSGLRGRISYAHESYDLGDPYEDYTGTAKVSTTGLSYPLIRNRNTNLVSSVNYQYKDLDDELQNSSYDEKSSHSLSLGLQFDHLDALAGGGITYGELSVTPGHLDSDNTGTIEGDFTKANIHIARIQSLPIDFSLFATFSGQWADNDLDSSESFILGGADAVRAYPQGEGAGSKGWLCQVELRYAINDKIVPYLFYDAGHTSQDAEDNSRSIAGAGAGLRYSDERWIINLASALRTNGGDALSDDKQRDHRFWFTVGYRF